MTTRSGHEKSEIVGPHDIGVKRSSVSLLSAGRMFAVGDIDNVRHAVAKINAARVEAASGVKVPTLCDRTAVLASGTWTFAPLEGSCAECLWYAAFAVNVTGKLAATLGPDFAELALRIVRAEAGHRSRQKTVNALTVATVHAARPVLLMACRGPERTCGHRSWCPTVEICFACSKFFEGAPIPNETIVAPCGVTQGLRAELGIPAPDADGWLGQQFAIH